MDAQAGLESALSHEEGQSSIWRQGVSLDPQDHLLGNEEESLGPLCLEERAQEAAMERGKGHLCGPPALQAPGRGRRSHLPLWLPVPCAQGPTQLATHRGPVCGLRTQAPPPGMEKEGAVLLPTPRLGLPAQLTVLSAVWSSGP